MDDLIKRQDAIDVIRTTVAEGMLADTIELRLNELPSAQKTGKWSRESTPSTMNFYLHRCSECEGTAEEAMKFCCHCGARMVNDVYNN